MSGRGYKRSRSKAFREVYWKLPAQKVSVGQCSGCIIINSENTALEKEMQKELQADPVKVMLPGYIIDKATTGQ